MKGPSQPDFCSYEPKRPSPSPLGMQDHHQPLLPSDVPTPTPCLPAIPQEASNTARVPGNKDKRAKSKAGTAGLRSVEIRGHPCKTGLLPRRLL
ncbi:hypothetical protein U0070_022163 [Myodes glareolus]|uniref:Uncharacterized protein n=1 Tax=Myodes glareolus TaxID=447135 RepID=A0AAW0IPG8_MYOGA